MTRATLDVDYEAIEMRALAATWGQRSGMVTNFGLIYGLSNYTPTELRILASHGLLPQAPPDPYEALVPGLREAQAGVKRPFHPTLV